MATQAHAVKEGQRFKGDANLTVVSCPSCHVTYAIPTSFHKSALKWRGDRADGRGWHIFCPFGHSWSYVGENEEERLARHLEHARNRGARLTAELDQTRAEARAQKAAKTRFKNERDRERKRAAAGVCPCCNRTFKQLARHMSSQHPDFGSDSA